MMWSFSGFPHMLSPQYLKDGEALVSIGEKKPQRFFGLGPKKTAGKSGLKKYTVSELGKLTRDHKAGSSVDDKKNEAVAGMIEQTLFSQNNTSFESLPAPKIPVTCIYGTGLPTARSIELGNGLDTAPTTMNLDDGDGLVPVDSASACKDWTPEKGTPSVDMHAIEKLGHPQSGTNVEMCGYGRQFVTERGCENRRRAPRPTTDTWHQEN